MHESREAPGSIKAVCQNIEETKTFHRDFVDDKMETATVLLSAVININSFVSSVSVIKPGLIMEGL